MQHILQNFRLLETISHVSKCGAWSKSSIVCVLQRRGDLLGLLQNVFVVIRTMGFGGVVVGSNYIMVLQLLKLSQSSRCRLIEEQKHPNYRSSRILQFCCNFLRTSKLGNRTITQSTTMANSYDKQDRCQNQRGPAVRKR